MAAQSPGGTSYSVFGNFPIPMAGKTGTAERYPNEDQSWYVALAPYPNPEIVVAATIEQGASASMPPRPWPAGSSTLTTASRAPAAKKAEKKFRGDSCAGPSATGSVYE